MSDNNGITPLHVEGVADYHCHCDYSIDAEGSIEQYCEAAIKRNLAEICFTTHYDANPESNGTAEYIRINGENKPVTPDNLAPYVDHVRATAERFYPRGLSVKLGLEMGWYTGCEESVIRLKERYDFDYMLCGMHELDDQCLCCRRSFEACFRRYPVEEMVGRYFEQLTHAAATGLFDNIAHADYYLKYGRKFYGEAIEQAHEPYIDDLFSALIAGETGLEINTSAVRQGGHEYYPRMQIVNAAKKAGVEVTRLGSDAHHPNQVGYDFEAAVALVPDTTLSGEE